MVSPTRQLSDTLPAVIGLGYVGLPLAIEFGKHYATLGYDIDKDRIAQLRDGTDRTGEASAEDLKTASGLSFTACAENLRTANTFIVTVPTPIDRNKRPNLEPLTAASRTVAGVLKAGDVVIFESTVFPGATEEVCIPIIESESGLKFNRDFFAGYSPERINPGDREHRVTDIVKITSGSTPETADFVDGLYGSIISAGTHRASSIRVAEAAKVIENTQRDLNIALVNELALIFERLGLDTEEVLQAAATKWNFLPFQPGLVGGHCIGVDPYYLTFKAEETGYHPEMILAGRRINDQMGARVVERLVKLMSGQHIDVSRSRILVLGLAFKENCPDIRNSRVIDIVNGLQDYNARVDVYDPYVCPSDAKAQYGIELITDPHPSAYDAIVLAVAHRAFIELTPAGIRSMAKHNHVIFDVKRVLPKSEVSGRL